MPNASLASGWTVHWFRAKYAGGQAMRVRCTALVQWFPITSTPVLTYSLTNFAHEVVGPYAKETKARSANWTDEEWETLLTIREGFVYLLEGNKYRY